MPATGASRRRMNRLFAEDGHSFMLALDAHSFSAAPQNVDRAVGLVSQMAPLGLDAALAPLGIATRQSDSLDDVALVLRCDASRNVLDPSVPGTRMVHGADDAVRIGADAVVAMTFLGAEDGRDGQDAVQVLASDAHRQGLPLIVESLPYTFSGKGTPGLDPAKVALGARLAEELGADVVKTRLTGTPEDKAVFDAVTVPVVALGGPKTGLAEYLEYLARCLDLGASGVAVGRNIVDDPEPAAKVAAMAALIHGGSTVDQALAIYKAG